MIADIPMAAMDTETSGVDVFSDFIVTAAVITIDGTEVHTDQWLLRPPDGRPIPESATAIHGITTAQARNEGVEYAEGYAAIRDRMETLWARGRLIVVMNASFDLSLIHWEGKRLGYPDLEVGPVVDPMCIDKAIDRYRRGKRTLTALCDHYGVKQGEAHDAAGDCLSAARVAYKLLRHPDMASFADTDSLMLAQTLWRAEQQASLGEYFTRQGNHEAAAGVDGAWPIIGKEPAA